MRTTATATARIDEPACGPAPSRRGGAVPRVPEILATAASLVHDAARPSAAGLEEVGLWCAEFGGVDPRLQHAALRQAFEVVVTDVLVADVLIALRARLAFAGPRLPTLAARGDIPRVLTALGLDDAPPPEGALTRTLPPRVARFYWTRLRAFVTWSAARDWPA
jgi:hypothetical protein